MIFHMWKLIPYMADACCSVSVRLMSLLRSLEALEWTLFFNVYMLKCIPVVANMLICSPRRVAVSFIEMDPWYRPKTSQVSLSLRFPQVEKRSVDNIAVVSISRLAILYQSRWNHTWTWHFGREWLAHNKATLRTDSEILYEFWDCIHMETLPCLENWSSPRSQLLWHDLTHFALVKLTDRCHPQGRWY